MTNKKINLLLGTIIGVVFLIIWLNLIDWQEFKLYFENYNLWKIIPYVAFYVLAYFFRSLRWREILKPISKLSKIQCFGIFSTGMLINFIIPVRLGELAKSIILKMKKKIPISSSLPTIFLDKLMDIFPILLVIIAIPLISMKLNNTLYIIIGLIIFLFLLLLFFCYTAIYHKNKLYDFISLVMKIFPEKIRDLIDSFLKKFLLGINIIRDPEVKSLKLLIYTLLAVISESIYIYMIFRLFGSKLSFFQIMLGYTLMNLTYILPTPPAQIGSNQFMWVLIFSFGLGADRNLTSAAVIVSHILTSIIIFAMGYLSMLLLKLKFTDVLSLTRKKKTENIL
ncbi:MAG: hypothetical protein APR54_10380 [Candidatus Cloacimonas sp. SDB]|nr:MAG: hypothetical protein APR54_10380 [Candidatus Cloacimonas sp. SDB]